MFIFIYKTLSSVRFEDRRATLLMHSMLLSGWTFLSGCYLSVQGISQNSVPHCLQHQYYVSHIQKLCENGVKTLLDTTLDDVSCYSNSRSQDTQHYAFMLFQTDSYGLTFIPAHMPNQKAGRATPVLRDKRHQFIIDSEDYKDKNSPYRRVTPEELEITRQLHKKGESLYAIAQRLGIKYSTLKNRMKMGFALATMDSSLQMHEDFIRELKYTHRLNCGQIQDQLGQLNVNASRQALYKFLRRLEPIDKSVQCSFLPEVNTSEFYCDVDCDVRNEDIINIDTE